MDDQNRNLILASVLSFLVIVAWFFFFPPPEPVQTSAVEATDASTNQQNSALPGVEKSALLPQANGLASGRRPKDFYRDPEINGDHFAEGGRIDDLHCWAKVDLMRGRKTLPLKPVGEDGAYYATYGWAALSGVTSNLVPTPIHCGR